MKPTFRQTVGSRVSHHGFYHFLETEIRFPTYLITLETKIRFPHIVSHNTCQHLLSNDWKPKAVSDTAGNRPPFPPSPVVGLGGNFLFANFFYYSSIIFHQILDVAARV
jgi:hypothetical protein